MNQHMNNLSKKSTRRAIYTRAIWKIVLIGALLYSAAPPAQAMSPMSLPTGIVPILDCVTFDQSNNILTASFGYVSANAQTESVAIGSANFFNPSPGSRGQPTSFLPGVHHNAFSVLFILNTTSSLTWTLLGQSVTASNNPALYCSSSSFTSTFTYQGRLTNGGSPANGTYELEFKLFDALTGGTQQPQPSPMTLDFTTANSNPVAVTGGAFTVRLDFGATAFPGWFLEIGVRNPGDSTFTTLSPRQPLTAAPFASRSQSARSVDSISGQSPDNVALATTSTLNATSQNVTGKIVQRDDLGNFSAGTITANLNGNATNVSGVVAIANGGTGLSSGPTQAGQFLRSTGSGAWDVSSLQASDLPANFNISGNGTLGGTLVAQEISATSVSVLGTLVHLKNTSTGGHEWIINSTGSSSFQGVGKLSFTDLTASASPLTIDGNGAFIAGNLTVNGTLSKSAGSFKIDDPLDPANKYLSHSFVESPDMMNIYNGNVTTDDSGQAVVTMPAYFEALNRDFRYQLTVIGQFAQAVVAEEIKDNRFVIKTDKPNVKVSWQVTGIRHDAYANAHRIPVEEDKPASERGTYLFQQLFRQPAGKPVQRAPQAGLNQRAKGN